MGGCAIKKCKSRFVKGGVLRFLRFPSNESMANEWLRYCRPKTNIKKGRVCSKHFVPSDYLKTLKYILLNEETPKTARALKPEAIPSLFINVDEENEQVMKDITEAQIENEVATVTTSGEDQITIPLNEYNLLNKKVCEYNKLKNSLEKIFTPGQLRFLMKPEKNKKLVKWSAEDISAAISLRNVSPKCYDHLRNVVGIPLPGYSTICRWIKNLNETVNL